MHKDLISSEVCVNFCLSRGPLNVICPEMLVINGAIEGKSDHLIFSIDFWGADHCGIEEVMSRIRPGYVKIRFCSQNFIIIG